MTHRSRIGVIVIDCRTDDLTDATAFWSAALGHPGRVDKRGKYTIFEDPDGAPRVLLQAVDHDPRVHLDIETDDKEAERARLEGLGATLVERSDHGWIVMEAPTGHRFCLVGPQTASFPGEAPEWTAP
jgi:hypothetical protein